MGKPVIESHRGDSVFRRDRTGKVLAYRGGAAGDAAAANSSNARATGRGRGASTETKTNFNTSLSCLHNLCKEIEKLWCHGREDSAGDAPSFAPDSSPNSTILDEYPSSASLQLLGQLRLGLRSLLTLSQDNKVSGILCDGDDEILALNRLGFKLRNLNISFHQFLCIATPIERLRNRYWLGENAFPRDFNSNGDDESVCMCMCVCACVCVCMCVYFFVQRSS